MLFDWKLLFVFVISSIVIIMSPGPDFIYVTTRGIAQGKKAGLLSALGISIGLLVHTLLAALGLSAILSTSGLAFSLVKYIGAGYLFYLGIKTILQKDQIIQQKSVQKINHKSIFQQAILTNVFNPKAVITFMAFIPQFINQNLGYASTQIIFLGCILALIAALWFAIIGYFAGTVGIWLSTKKKVQDFIRWITGTVLIGLGVRLLYTKK